MEWLFNGYSRVDIATLSLWIVNTLYAVGIIPQIILNFRRKSVEGVSDLMILGYMAGYLTQIIYIFALDLPMAYKVLVPIGALFIAIIIAQRFYYEYRSYSERRGFLSMLFGKTKQGVREVLKNNWLLLGVYALLTLAILCSLPVAFIYPYYTGHIMGWISVFLWTIYQIPQGIKMFLEKSTQGFSFWFATIMAGGVLVELISSFILGLPYQTLLISARGLVGYGIFCVEFVMYRKQR